MALSRREWWALTLIGCVMLAAFALIWLATPAHAQTEEVVAIAAEAGVDPIDLLGALQTTQLAPRHYLTLTGELPQPLPTVWDRLSMCEATGNWRANTGNGYYGGLQADLVFWRRHGGLAFAPRPDLATREQQILVAQRGLAVQGPGAWPVCGRRVGLTR